MSFWTKIAEWFNGRPVVRPRYTVRVDVDSPSGDDDTDMIQSKIDLAVFVGQMLPANMEIHFPSGTWKMGKNRHLSPGHTTFVGKMYKVLD